MKLFVALSLILAAGTLFGCSRQARPATATAPPLTSPGGPTTLSAPAPIPSSTTAPELRTGGWLVFVRDGDLYVGALEDGAEQRLTSGRTIPGLAGYAGDGAGETWIYYTSVVERRSDAGGMVAVERRRLEGAASEELFTFQTGVQQLASSEPIATVSPDGRYVAYADEHGLRLYDVAARMERSLLTNRVPDSGNTPGNIYLSPLWAPTGGWLVVTRTGYPPNDKPTLDFIRPLETTTEYTADGGGAFRSWSPDGIRLCASHAGGFEKGFTSDAVGLVTPGESQFQTLLRPISMDRPGEVPTQVQPNACVWSNDGRVAISYGVERSNGGAVSVFSPTGVLTSRLQMEESFGVIGWLPDGLGFIRSVDGGLSRAENIVLMLDGSVRGLPFRPDRVVAVIPPA